MTRHGAVKQKTRKSAAKRFRFSKSGKAMRRYTMQSHFNAGRPKKTIRGRRRDRAVHAVDTHRITGMLPFSNHQRTARTCQG